MAMNDHATGASLSTTTCLLVLVTTEPAGPAGPKTAPNVGIETSVQFPRLSLLLSYYTRKCPGFAISAIVVCLHF